MNKSRLVLVNRYDHATIAEMVIKNEKEGFYLDKIELVAIAEGEATLHLKFVNHD